MMSLRKYGVPLAVLLFGLGPSFAQNNPTVPVAEIVQRIAAIETEHLRAWWTYNHRREMKVEELDANNKAVGEYRIVIEVSRDAAGQPTEKNVDQPPSTLKRIGMTEEDLRDLREPLFFTTDTLSRHILTYKGKETVRGTDCYLFDIKPKSIEKGQRYYEGLIWVEDRDLHIVKSDGRAGPDIRRDQGAENVFPRLETYRVQIGDNWFPSEGQAVDTLNFSSGGIRIRQSVKFDRYRKP